MTIKEFINNFKISNPNWSCLPAEFPDCDLSDLTSKEIGRFNSIKALWQLNQASQPKQASRVWQDPKGYKYLAAWQNAALLRVMIRILTQGFSKSEYRRKNQMDDAARSTVRNIEEGWKRPTTSEYLDFIGYSQASLEEVKGDIRDCKTDGLLKSVPGSSLRDVGIDLRVVKGLGKGKIKGAPEEPGHPYHRPLLTLNSNTLTYEIFIELINKTDWLLRKLVESLEKKLSQDKKYYQVGQARIRDKFRKK